MDGYLKRQAKGAELCGTRKEIPHGPTDGKAVRGAAAETEVHADRAETKLGAYKQQIGHWLEEAPYSTVRILEKLLEQGFEGTYSIAKEYVRGKKMDLAEKAPVRFETIPGKQGQMDRGSSRITRCTRMESGRNCTVSS